MLNYRNTNIVFLLLLLAMLAWSYQAPVAWWVWVLLLLAYSLVLFYGSYYVGSNFFMKVLCRGKGDQPWIALSFDDGPAEQYTSEILDVLGQKKVGAIFFCIGKNIAGKENVLERMHREGHLIGNHSQSHAFWFDLYQTKDMKADLTAMMDATEKTIGRRPRLFRPPYGVTTPPMRRAVDQLGIVPVGWDIRSLDTVIKNEDELLGRILRSLKSGSIVLLHDTSAATLAILPRLIDAGRARGLEWVRIDQLLNENAYA
ncbi:MAG: polysaccharide deacetylase family protein [Bacteroidota bacterium]|nr:polysaccharide deacetylase family protein [Bacteroidota bacterium]